MKKLKYLFIILLLLIIPFNVFASGGYSVSSSNISMYVGESKTVTVSASNAAGRLDFSSTNASVATVSKANSFLDNSSDTITITGRQAGTATIRVYATQFATYDEEILTGSSKYITVNVVNKSGPTPTPTPSPVIDKKNNNVVDTSKSSDTSLRSLGIDGYNLVRIDDNNYSLVVNNNVSSVNVKAEPNHSKAKVTGTGVHNLEYGTNTIELVITAESGATNIITIKVNRRLGYELSELPKLLKDKTIDCINILLSDNLVLDTKYINLIKNSDKEVNFDYYDTNKKLKYTWILKGNKVSTKNSLSTKVTFDSDNKNNISKLSNYADGLYLHVVNNDIIGSKLKVYVGDKYQDGSIVNVYRYLKDNNSLSTVVAKIKVKDGYITFDFVNADDFLVTMSNIPGLDVVEVVDNKSLTKTIIMVIAIVLLVQITTVLCILGYIKRDKIKYFFKKKRISKKEDEIKKNPVSVGEVPVNEDVNTQYNNMYNVNNIVNETETVTEEEI